jgi:hypothetical protein
LVASRADTAGETLLPEFEFVRDVERPSGSLWKEILEAIQCNDSGPVERIVNSGVLSVLLAIRMHFFSSQCEMDHEANAFFSYS